VWFYTQSVMSTHTSVIECEYDTSVNMTLKSMITTCSSVFYTRRVRFLYIQCDFDRHECDYNTHECDFNTHKCDFNTHKIDFYIQSTIFTLKL
jgi:hypothetical protein